MLKLPLLFLLIFGLGLVGILLPIELGQQQVAAPIFLETGNCEQPCWQGIRPGTRQEAAFFLELSQIDRYGGRLRISEDGTLLQMELLMHGDILLGEVFLAMGTPSHAALRRVAGQTARSATRQPLVGGLLYYGNGLVEVEVVRGDSEWYFSPDMRVRQVRYFMPHPEGNIIPIGTGEWHGFGKNYLRDGL